MAKPDDEAGITTMEGRDVGSSALVSDFRQAGLSGRLAPWEAPWLAERVLKRFPDADADELVASHQSGLRERVRKAVADHIAGLDTVDEINVGQAIEYAAEAADISPEEIIDILFALAPAPSAKRGRSRMLMLAELALEDYQRVPARRRCNDPHRGGVC